MEIENIEIASTSTSDSEFHNSVFSNGNVSEHIKWLDTDGNLINAHDGGIIYANGQYHWYGMALRPYSVSTGGQKTTVGVVMYCSNDLYNWSYEGVILECSPDPASPLCGPMRFERPKIIYNEATDKYVMWFHYVGNPGDHGIHLGSSEAGVASCSTVNGKYTFHGCHRPLGDDGAVKDCTLYKDDDQNAYFIYDRKVSTSGSDFSRILHIVKLSEDYLVPTSTFGKIGHAPDREAPVMLKHNGFYFLITSGVTGWYFNQAQYYRSTNILGPYIGMGDPCTGSNTETTFNSQGTYAFQVEDKKDAFIFISERHNKNCMTDSSFLFLPITFPSSSSLELRYLSDWNLNYWPDEDSN